MEFKQSILYVDDEELNILLFKVNFSNMYNVYTAKGGEEGLAILNDNPHIEIVISDLKMPKMNGIEFIQFARAKYPQNKYYILTGYKIDALQNHKEEGLILETFEKPINKELILSHINA